MGFVDELRARNGANGSASYFGQPQETNIGSTLDEITPFMNNTRMMNTADWKDRATFANNLQAQGLPVRQNRLQTLSPQQPQNVVYQPPTPDPNALTGYQRGQLDLGNKELALSSADKSNDNSLNREKLNLDKQQFGLETKKNEQIYGTKIADMERKADDATKRLQLSYDQLQAKQNDAAAHIEFNKAQREAADARHELDLARRDAAAEETKRLHDAQIEKINAEMEVLKGSTTTTEVNPEGTKRTTSTVKGTPKGATIKVKAPDGTTGSWPANETLPKGYTRIP